MMVQQQSMSGKADSEQQARAMADPEIRNIVNDPIIQTVLRDMQADPRAAQKHLANPQIVAKLEKLQAAGILQMK